MPKWTDYTIKTTVADNDEIMTLDTVGKANKRLSLSTLSDWVLGKIADKVFEKLQTNSKTILGAINELNSKTTINKWNFYSGLSTTSDEIKELSSKGHLAGILIVDQNGRSNIYATGKTSKVTPISITYNDIESPTIVNDTFKIPLKAWSAYLFISDDPEVKTL